jgi:hypothetical protein
MPRGCAFWRGTLRLVGPLAPVIRNAAWAGALLLIVIPFASRAEPAAPDGGTSSPSKSDAPAPPTEAVKPDGTKPDGAKPDELKPDTAKSAKAVAHPETLCLTVEAAAQANNLPITFFARVIWQESRFNAKAVGPLTRSGGRAQGIAQFMPRTAEEKGLLDPFDPVQALPKSAEYLRELADEFGNLGLAAAAYNAGPRRVHEWLAGSGGMPFETRNYVFAITGASVEDWAQRADKIKISDVGAKTCSQLVALLKQSPNRFVDSLERRLSSAVLRPWGVQLSAGFSRARLMRAYAAAEKKFGSLIAGHDLNVFSLRLRSRGTLPFYQLRIGTDTWQQAIRLCDKIRKVGGACITLKNSGHAI